MESAYEEDVKQEVDNFVADLHKLRIDGATEEALDSLDAVEFSTRVSEQAGPSEEVKGEPDEKEAQTYEFLEEDEDFQRKLAKGGNNPSASVDRWARNRLNRFRESMGWDKSVGIEDVSPRECVQQLCKFFECVTKQTGELYPTYTLMGLYRAINRILRRAQEKRILATGIEEVPLNLRKNAMYKAVGVAAVLAMERSRKAGANKPRKKAAVITECNEEEILAHMSMQITHPRGVLHRTFYFMENRFLIRGGEELYKVLKANFLFSSDPNGNYVRYDERLSKSYQVGLDCYQDEDFRPPVTIYNADVVATFDAMIRHSNPGAVYLFMQCVDNPRKYWFSLQRLGEKTLGGMMKTIFTHCGLASEGITNKSGRTTRITRMAAAGVPPEVGAKISGHKSLGAYARYDRSVEAQVQAAQSCIANGGTYQENLKVETQKFTEHLVYGKRKGELNERDLPKAKMGKENESEKVAKTEKVVQMDENIGMPKEKVVRKGKEKMGEVVNDDVKAAKGSKNALAEKLDEWDEWADEFDWNEYEEKVMTERTLNVQPITAVFGKIHTLSNCNVSITIKNLSSER